MLFIFCYSVLPLATSNIYTCFTYMEVLSTYNTIIYQELDNTKVSSDL